jgi:hypothetical protein
MAGPTQIRGNTQIMPGTIPDAQISATAAIQTSKLADGANFIQRDGSVPMTGSLDLGSHTLVNLATPVNSTDGATKAYVDALANGRDWKPSVRTVSTANINTASAPATVNGVTLAAGNRLLLKDQTTASENGIWVFNGTGVALTRAADAVQGTLSSQATTFVEEGTVNAGTEWNLSTADPITVGTTSQTWVKSGAGAVYTGSNGITVTGTVIAPTYGSTANTVCQGNDARLSDARTPVGTALAQGQFWIGNGANLAAAVAPSGDVSSISAAGAVTLDVTKAQTFARFVNRETPTGTVNGSNVTFTLAHTPVSGTERILVNGIEQDAGAGNDYTLAGGTLTFLTGAIPQTNDKVRATYWY